MKKILLLSICLFTLVSTAESASLFRSQPQHYRIKRVPSQHHLSNPYINNSSNLSMMEQALFRQDYSNENINTRLSRLEENMFGETVPGTIEQRYKNLTNAFKYSQPNPYYNPYGHYYNGPYSAETNKKLNIINKLANFVGGTTTGVTPEIENSTGYYYNEGYSSPFGSGYFNQNRNYGRGMGVQIIND